LNKKVPVVQKENYSVPHPKVMPLNDERLFSEPKINNLTKYDQGKDEFERRL